MKKLLVLLLVLGMASTASAVLTYSKSPTTVTIDGIIEADVYVIVTSDAILSPLSDLAIGTAAPSMTEYFLDVAPGDGFFGDLLGIPAGFAGGSWTVNSAPGEDYVEGNYLTLSISGSDILAYTYNETTQEIAEIVPEPMTIALLGLGGLFLLRRRK